MKLSLFVLFLILPVIFFSCKSDNPVIPETETGTEYFDWSIQDIPGLYNVSRISSPDPNHLFIAGNISYLLSNGILTQINFEDPLFIPYDVKAFDSTYAIFWGKNGSINSDDVFKIYNNEVIQSYQTIGSLHDLKGPIYIYEKNKFLIFWSGVSAYYEFDNGVFTVKKMPNPGFANFIGKSDNTDYLFVSDYSPYTYHNIYKFLGDSMIHVKTELNKSDAFQTENIIMREEYYTTFQRFTYFSGTDWNTTLIYNDSSGYYINYYNAGQSNNFFVNLTLDSTSYFKAKVWDGSTFSRQINFPSSVKGTTSGTDQRISEYKNGTFYFYFKSGSGKLLKGVRKN